MSYLPRFLPWEPKSFYELEICFTRPFYAFRSWCARRSIPHIRQNHEILPKAMPIAPEQGFYDDVRQIATIGDFFEDGACFMAKPEHPVFLMSAVLDVAAKRALASPSYGIERSESLTEFNVAPCNMMKQGMEALGLYKTKSPTGNPYLVALCLRPGFCRDDALEKFVASTNLSRNPVSLFGSPSDYEQTETMWSLVFDACVASQCTSFVVSSYDRWVFGEFTTDFSIATVSSIYDGKSVAPSVPEALYQWIGHAFHMAQLQKNIPVGAVEQDEWPLSFKDMQFTVPCEKLMSLWEIQ